MNSSLNECLSLESNLDQTGRAFIQDVVQSMLDEGCVAIVPVDTDLDPENGSHKIETMRTGKILEWYPQHVKVRVYNELTGFRCFLLRLGFIGAEFKDERKILLRDLFGNSAFKSGKRCTEALQPEPPASTAAVEVQGDRELAEALADELLIQQVNASFGEEVAS